MTDTNTQQDTTAEQARLVTLIEQAEEHHYKVEASHREMAENERHLYRAQRSMLLALKLATDLVLTKVGRKRS